MRNDRTSFRICLIRNALLCMDFSSRGSPSFIMTTMNVRSAMKKGRAKKLVIVGLGLGLCLLSLILALFWLNRATLFTHQTEPQRVEDHVKVALPIRPGLVFSYLRFVDVMGCRFVMLKHNPTAQRIMVLTTTLSPEGTYRNLYERTLSTLEFTVLIELFKPETKFVDQPVVVETVSMDNVKHLKQSPYQIDYKRYRVATRVNEAPQNFEAYMGKILQGKQIRGLIFTFNSEGDTSLEPFRDLLRNLSFQPVPPS